MDITRLHTFYLVAKLGNLPKAANVLRLTPSAISYQLKTLENELSVRLFDRYPNKLVLTHKGRLVLKQVQHVFDSLARLEGAVTKDTGALSGKVTIGLGRDLAKLFAPQIAEFSHKHPQLRISILSRTSSEALSGLIAGDLDLVINRVPTVPRGILKRKLLGSKLYVVFPREHQLSEKAVISLRDVANFPLILHATGSNTRRVIDLGFSEAGIDVQNILEVATCESIIQFVQLSIGVGIVHDICLPGLPTKRLQWYEMTRQFKTLEISLVYRKPAAVIPSHRALIDMIIESAQQTATQQKV